MTKSVKLFVRVKPQMAEALDAVVGANTGDRSDHIRQALDLYIQDQQRKQRYLQALAVADDDTAPQPAS